MEGVEDVLVEDIMEEQLRKEKEEEERGSDEEATPIRREGQRQVELRVRKRRETKTQARTSTSSTRLRAQMARMQADMSAMKDLVQKAITPGKISTAGASGGAERTGKSGVSNSLMTKIAPRRLTLEVEDLQTPPIMKVGRSNEGGENIKRMIEEKQKELMALLAAEENEGRKDTPVITSPHVIGNSEIGVGKGDIPEGQVLNQQTKEGPARRQKAEADEMVRGNARRDFLAVCERNVGDSYAKEIKDPRLEF